MRRIKFFSIVLCWLVILPLYLFTSCDRFSATTSTATTASSEVTTTTSVTPTNTPTPTITSTPTPSPTPTPTPSPTPKEILISFIGDTTLGEQSKHAGMSYCFTNVVGTNYSYPFSLAKEYLEKDDMTLVNLEGPLTRSTKLRPDREIYLKGDPRFVEVLKQGSVECANIANNHQYDYTEEGCQETRDTLDEAGIIWSDASHFSTYEVKGVKIGMAGFNFTYERKLYYKAIDKLREEGCDIVIISCHIGVEKMYEPENAAIELAHDIIDYGADIYVGSHPHRLQPVEFYNGKYIIYSESNFCFGGQPWLSDPDTAIFQCSFFMEDGHVKYSRMQCIPFSMRSTASGNDYRPMPYQKGTEEYDRVMKKLRWSDENE